jgi:peroxiredoxin
MRADIRPGAAFPDYQLPDHTGTPRRLSEIQGSDPMIIVLAREAYSAKDQRQHEGLIQLWSEMKPGVGYCRMVTITTSDPQETFNYRSGVNAEWPFLSDTERIVQRDLDIAEYTDPAHNQMSPTRSYARPAWSYTRSTTATGSSGGRPSKSCGWTCGRCCGNVTGTGTCPIRRCGPPGTSARPIASTRRSWAGHRTKTPARLAQRPGATARPQPGRRGRADPNARLAWPHLALAGRSP